MKTTINYHLIAAEGALLVTQDSMEPARMDCPPVSPGGGSEVPEALLEPGVGAGLTGSPW